MIARTSATALWPAVRVGSRSFASNPAIGDVDGDGSMEIVVGSLDRKVYVVCGTTGRVERSIGTEAEIFGSPLLVASRSALLRNYNTMRAALPVPSAHTITR